MIARILRSPSLQPRVSFATLSTVMAKTINHDMVTDSIMRFPELECTLLIRKIVQLKLENIRSCHELQALRRATASATMFDVGLYHLKVHYATEADARRGIENLKFAHRMRHLDSTYQLGLCYLHGVGVTQNEQHAVQILRKAAKKGHSAAQYSLYECYSNGAGVTQDLRIAMRFCRLAADEGHADAIVTLQQRCINEANCPNPENVVRSLTHVVETGEHVLALRLLSTCYSDGFGVFKDAEKSFWYLQRAADAGDVAAQHEVAVHFGKTAQSDPQHTNKAAIYCHLAAQQGHAGAQNDLGVLYERGSSVIQSFPEAVRYFQMAAAQGDALAQHNLGVCYKHGRGVARNTATAEMYFKLSADQNNADAQYKLGEHYWLNAGLSTDISVALRYWALAAAQGHLHAQMMLFLVYSCGLKDVPVCRTAARAYLGMLLQQPDHQATVKLALQIAPAVARSLLSKW